MSLSARSELITLIAQLIHRSPDIERAVIDADLDVSMIAWDERPINTWRSVLTVSEDQRKVEELFGMVLKEKGGNDKLRSAIEAYRLEVGREHCDRESRVFISFAPEEDDAFVEQLYEDLQAAGIVVTLDRSSLHLLDLRSKGNGDKLILVIGPKASELSVDWKHALQCCLEVIPLLRIGESDTVPVALRNLGYYDFRDKDGYTEGYGSELEQVLQRLRDNTTPVGELSEVPRLPTFRIERKDVLAELKAAVGLQEQDRLSRLPALVGITGMGGIGKSMLMNLLARDCDVRRTFPDGIYWIEIGQDTSRLTNLQAKLAGKHGVSLQGFEADVNSWTSILRDRLKNKACLLLLDDVWDRRAVDAFHVLGKRGRIVFTTREYAWTMPLGIHLVRVPTMTREEAVDLIGHRAGSTDPLLTEIAERLGRLPLALNLAGAILNEEKQLGVLSPAKWLAEFDAIAKLKLDDTQERTNSLEACFKISVDRLKEGDQLLYHSLGVFPQDTWVPQSVILAFWKQLSPTAQKGDLCSLLDSLVRVALVDRYKGETVMLHDLLSDYTRRVIMQTTQQYEGCHRKLLSAYNPEEDNWSNLIKSDRLAKFEGDGGYIYYHLPYHLKEAGDKKQMFSLLQDMPRWMEHEPRDLQNERLLLLTWDACHKQDEKSARAILEEWLDRPLPRTRDSIYSAREVAVQCAFRAGFDDLIQKAMRHRDASVREAAGQANYFRYMNNWQQGIANLQTLAENETQAGFPKPLVLRSVLSNLLVLLVHEYQTFSTRGDEIIKAEDREKHEIRVQQLYQIGLKSLNDGLMTNSPYPNWMVSTVRRWVLKAALAYVMRMISTGKGVRQAEEIARRSADPNDLDDPIQTTVNAGEASEFLRTRRYLSPPFQQILPFLDLRHGDLFNEVPIEVLANSFDGTLGYLATEFALVVHGVHKPDEASGVIRRIFDWNDDQQSSRQTVCCAAWRRILMHQSRIEQRWLGDYRQMICDHYDTFERDYGIIKLTLDNYQYFPLTWYAQIWDRVSQHTGEPVDLVEHYLQRAESRNNRILIHHIINGFGDPRATFMKYAGILQHFNPYLATDDPDLRRVVVRSLARIRSRDIDTVNTYLNHQRKADYELCKDVELRSHSESHFGLVLSFSEVFSYLLAFGGPNMMSWLLDDIDSVVRQESVADALMLIFDLFIANLERQNR